MPPMISRVAKASHFQEVPQQTLAFLREDGLGMKLHAMDGQFFVAEAHDLGVVVAGGSGDFETVRQGIALHEQGMIARGFKRLRHVFEHGLAGMMDHGRFAVHETFGPNDFTAEDVANGLMAKTNAEQRCGFAKALDHGATDAGFFWRARAGGDADVVGLEPRDLIQRDLIIATDFHDGTHFAEVLDEIVGEGIVVVDDQEHGIKVSS